MTEMDTEAWVAAGWEPTDAVILVSCRLSTCAYNIQNLSELCMH